MIHRMLSLGPDNPYGCGRCGKVFNNYKDFTEHVWVPLTAWHMINEESEFEYYHDTDASAPLLCASASTSQPTRTFKPLPAGAESQHVCESTVDTTGQITAADDIMPEQHLPKCNIYIEAGDWTFEQRAFVWYWMICQGKEKENVAAFLKYTHGVSRNGAHTQEMMAEQLSRGMWVVFNAYVIMENPKTYPPFEKGDWDAWMVLKDKGGRLESKEAPSDSRAENESEGQEAGETTGTEGSKGTAKDDEADEGQSQLLEAGNEALSQGEVGTQENPIALDDD
ncbi:MAG: hypothetical protein M1835_000185 [Candelina submexicana]|nr:MAG: hypothetical protein M1835_000185 [Candelina submexicana]